MENLKNFESFNFVKNTELKFVLTIDNMDRTDKAIIDDTMNNLIKNLNKTYGIVTRQKQFLHKNFIKFDIALDRVPTTIGTKDIEEIIYGWFDGVGFAPIIKSV